MKISLKWLKEYVELPADLTVEKLVYDLTMSTVEVEGVTELARKFDNMVIGILKEVLPHPNADKLKICRTDIGNAEMREIVCGGSNLEVGMKVAVALPGALVRWHGEGELIALGKVKIRGVESYGMICSSSEIDLFDLFPYEEEATIMDLSRFDVKAGTLLAVALGMDDLIFEVDNKSITNRPDLWGHYGISREISAIYNLPLKKFSKDESSLKSNLVKIDNPLACLRYIAVKMAGVEVKPSPFEMQKLLWSLGIKPINAIVDITNYVMLATGQPTHAFDADKLKGNIIVRKANKKEKLILLGDKEIELDKEDLVIADGNGPIGLAGVMGGKDSSVCEKTDNIILEIANFEATGVRKTATRHEIRTESATRYEKGIDTERCNTALALAMKMFSSFFPELEVLGFQDNYPHVHKRSEIEVSLAWLEKRMGKRIADEEIKAILTRLGFEITFNGDIMHVIAPIWRSTGDISIQADILEEIARIHGFENFEATPIKMSFTESVKQLDVDVDRKLREYLAFRCGMQEIFTYPWVKDEYIETLLETNKGMLSLVAPPAPNEKYLKNSIIPNLCKAVAENLRFANEFAIFESTQIFFDEAYETKYSPNEALPAWKRSVAGAFVADSKDLGILFRRVKGIIEGISHHIHVKPITFEEGKMPIWAEKNAYLNIYHEGNLIGNMGLLPKKKALDCGIKNSIVVLFELDIDSLKPYPSRENKFREFPEYPITEYDLSLHLDTKVKWEEITQEALKVKTDLIQDIIFVDEYRGEQVPAGKKSLTLRLLVGSFEKTLTSNEIEDSVGQVLEALKKELGAELRH